MAHWFVDMLKIIAVDLVVSADNALVIALASHKLPSSERRKAMLIGVWLAALFRVFFVLLTAKLLEVPYLKTLGGILLVLIAIRLLRTDPAPLGKRVHWLSLASVVTTIVISDMIISLDNVLALAGLSGPDFITLFAGLTISIFLIMISSDLILRLLDRFPPLLYLGAAILSWTAGEMMVSDRLLRLWVLTPNPLLERGIPAMLTLLVLLLGLVRQLP
jgi:YjbE family integral membrane protein